MSSSRAALTLPRRRPPVGWLVAASCLAAAGCGPQGPSREALIVEWGSLPAARASASAELARRVAELERRGELPAQLGDPTEEQAGDAAAALARSLDDPLRIALGGPLGELLERGDWRFEEADLFFINRLLGRHAELIEQLRAAAELPETRLPVGTQLGFFASTSYLDDAAIATRFALLAAAADLHRGESASAVDQLLRAARWITPLSHGPRLEPRLQAARLRGEWLDGAAAVAAHPSATRGDYERLFNTLEGWLADWPDAARAVIGDRAATLHGYEAVRVGALGDLATRDERARLERYGVTPDTPPAPDAIDADELAYLGAIDRLLATLPTPYHARDRRAATAAGLLEEDERPTSPLAAELFLPGLPSALEAMAIDRARCEAWALALAAAGGFRMPGHATNPHGGAPYRVERLERSLRVVSDDPAVGDAFVLVRNPGPGARAVRP